MKIKDNKLICDCGNVLRRHMNSNSNAENWNEYCCKCECSFVINVRKGTIVEIITKTLTKPK